MGRINKRRGKTNLSGLAGHIEFYTVKGETFFKSHAKRHRKSRSKKARSGRSNFASVVKFANAIIKIPELKEIMSHSSLEGRNAFQKLIKYNMPLAYDGDLTIKNFCTPKGVDIYIPDLFLDDDTLNFEFDVYGKIKPPLKLHMFLYLYNTKIKDGFKFIVMPKCIKITQDDIDEVKKKGNSKYIINNKLIGDERKLLSNYKDVIVFITVTGTPSIANRKYWTNTVGFDIPLV
jgi:hypothetical protein